ncbi:uncharacterized protein FFB20_03400 [Fusarium fujikuroi]|uniref:Uncharacterized protein n=1 Tax=Fusarium fujikuroi TaxID=5127 RepID=A0A2H3SPV6_FUSFU|nr:uncharacterized protein FFB20_03400 [Fusarium fujikuroi]SCO11698.1 uncharacterized protein FFE2_12403 [Fusarium fujikuroi]SCO20182.1 uncharacterized protein FFM5_12295 [Fusarium fujikuroi]SCO23083.1 uncharacterized protein FFC1_14639 [Fusarium fujikuroi]SCO50514.1 uncharacterized protein FFNC_13090 [Fusarium fujikuroi]
MCSIRGMDPMLAALLVQAHSTPPPHIPSRAASSSCIRRSCPWTTMNLSLLTCELRRGQIEVFAMLKLQPRPSVVAKCMDDPTLRK